MEPIKFEDHIREQLQEREIQPSKDAWKKLNLQSNKSVLPLKRKYGYAIAASIVGLLIVSSLLFVNQDFDQDKTTIVNENKTQIKEPKEEIIPVSKIEKVVVAEEKETKTKISENQIKDKTTKPKIVKNTIIATTDNKIIASENSQEPSIIASVETTNKTIKSPEELLIDLKINEVVAEINLLQKENNSVTVDEIEELLIKAQSEIHSKNLFVNNSKKVDATALLETVETELETSFREKVFDALGERFKKVRTAVLERDQ